MRMYRKSTEELLTFIEKSPSCYHAVSQMETMLEEAGYRKLQESEKWELIEGGKYYVSRNGSSVIAFAVPCSSFRGFQIMASHSDSPAFKIKEHAEMVVDQKFTKLNVERYGGMIMSPWLDRPLSVAGKLIVKEDEKMVTRLVDVDRDLVLIPNLAIHMNREVNDGYKYNPQVDLLPLFGDETAKGSFMKIIAEAAGVEEENIWGSDLFLYNRVPGTFWGANEEYFSSARLDDLQCAYASLKAFLQAENKYSVKVHCVLDNEEVGSGTKQGAASTFLSDVLHRINSGMGRSEEEYRMALASSFMLSSDNAHSVHPNQPDKADPTNRPYMNGGIVIKYNANQKYCTDSVSAAIFRMICENAEVPYQTYANRSDILGGSTLGNISNTQVAVNTVDIGLAQLAMHSPYETGGVKDTWYLIKAAEEFFSSTIYSSGDGIYTIEK